VGVWVTVGVGVVVNVLVKVGVGVNVEVLVFVGVTVGLAVAVGVALITKVAVGLLVGVLVGVAVVCGKILYTNGSIKLLLLFTINTWFDRCPIPMILVSLIFVGIMKLPFGKLGLITSPGMVWIVDITFTLEAIFPVCPLLLSPQDHMDPGAAISPSADDFIA
jgi:hypothetical protein